MIADDEDLEPWLNMHTHTNIVSAYDDFVDEETGYRFQMVECNNGGSLYSHVEKLRLNLAQEVPISYIKFIYDVVI